MTTSPIPSTKYVANALVLYVYVGDYYLPLDHSYVYEVTSDTRGYHGDTCRSGDDHVVRMG